MTAPPIPAEVTRLGWDIGEPSPTHWPPAQPSPMQGPLGFPFLPELALYPVPQVDPLTSPVWVAFGPGYFPPGGFVIDGGGGGTVSPPAIPEPATWATLLIGFGAVGVAARRKGWAS